METWLLLLLSLQAGVSNPLKDDRFAAMFTNPDFQVDKEIKMAVQILKVVVSVCLYVCLGGGGE